MTTLSAYMTCHRKQTVLLEYSSMYFIVVYHEWLLLFYRFSDRGRIFSKQEIRAIQMGPGGVFFTGDGTGELKVWQWVIEGSQTWWTKCHRLVFSCVLWGIPCKYTSWVAGGQFFFQIWPAFICQGNGIRSILLAAENTKQSLYHGL
jgi:hypothetical protein